MHYSKYYNDDPRDPVAELTNKFDKFSLNGLSHRRKITRKITKPLEVEIDPEVMNINNYKNIYPRSFKFGRSTVKYMSLDNDSQEYEDIIDLISDDNLEVLDIEKVYNPYLKKAFELRRNLLYNCVLPEKLFHGTKIEYIPDICSYNFDWRWYGSERGHRFGKGVSFSPKASYAAHYCGNAEEKVMILADVLIQESSIGTENTTVPPRGFDTTEKENGDVVVKYYDNEFYPSYVIHFFNYHNNRRRRRWH